MANGLSDHVIARRLIFVLKMTGSGQKERESSRTTKNPSEGLAKFLGHNVRFQD